MHNYENKIATQSISPDTKNTLKELNCTFWLLLNISEFELCNMYFLAFSFNKYFHMDVYIS